MYFSVSKFFIGLSFLTLTVCAVLSFSPPVSTQSAADTPWNLYTYIWNERTNLWARSVCTMPFGGLGTTSSRLQGCDYNVGSPPPASPCNINFCSGTALPSSQYFALRKWNSAVKYYHDGKDMDGDGLVTEASTSDIKPGEIRGSAWSPVYGRISFDLADFPADDVTTTTVNESACYGLTGSARQARVVRVGLGANSKIDRTDSVYNLLDPIGTTKIALVGCAYALLQRDFILLSPVGSDKNLRVGSGRDFASAGDLWSGVHVHPVTDSATKRGTFSGTGQGLNPPYIQLFGCGWSEKNGTWSFGPNIDQAGVVDCLPSGANKQNAELLRVTDNTAFAVQGAVSSDPLVTTDRETARIGQRVTYTAKCPAAHSKTASIQIYEDAEDVEALFYPTVPLTAQQIQNRIDRYTAALRMIRSDEPGTGRTVYQLAELIFSPIAALRISCFDGHYHRIFPGNSVAVSRGVNVESIILQSFTAAPSVIREGGLVSLRANITNFGNPASNGGYCTVTNTLSDEQVLCFETKGFAPTQSLTLCGSSTGRDSCVGDSKDAVVRDATYELHCHYDSSPATTDTYRDISFCRSTYNHAADTSWKTVKPVTAQVKVLPSRLIDRHISRDLSVPTLRKRRDGANEYVDISIPTADYYGYEIRLYELDGTTPTVDPGAPNRIITFFRNNTQADGRTKQRCIAGSRPVGETHTACLIRELYGTATGRYVVIGSLTHSILKSAVTGKRLVAEIYTDDGRRSEKVAFDPDRIPPQSYLEVKRVGDGTVTLQWDNPDDPTVTNWFYRTKKGDGPYRSWRLMGGGPGSGSKISKRISFESCHTTSSTNCTRAGPALKNGIEYTVQIRAQRRNVYGAPSNPVTARPYRSTCGSVQSSSNADLVADCETLLTIESALTGGVGNLNWSVTRPMTGWTGVTIAGGKLTALRINSRSLGGTIPSELALLDDLTVLEMTGNQLAGAIPDELGNMTNLRTLFLNNNWLTGSIPDTLARLTNLTYLRLHNNRLTGTVPTALAGLENNLSSFQIHGNNLTGCIPGVFSLTTSTVRGQEWQINPQRGGGLLTHCP